MIKGPADLHMHTTASDGTDSIKDRVGDAREKGVSCIAITDHDTIHEELDQRIHQYDDVTVITGCEIKTGIGGDKIELLGYFLDPDGEEIQELLETVRQYRLDRMEEMVERLRDGEGIDISVDDVIAHADESLARPHLARALVENGVVGSVEEAFERFISSSSPYYVDTKKVKPEKVIEAVHENGGVVSLAHPGRSLPADKADEAVGRLAEAGLDAIEVRYSYERLRDRDTEVFFGSEQAAELAERHDLLWTCGSDCHGSQSNSYLIGSVTLGTERLHELQERRERYSR